MRARDFDPIPAFDVPAPGTRIYFDPVRLADMTPPATPLEITRDGPIGIRAMVVTPDGTVYHNMTLRGARRRLDDFADAIEAASRGLFANLDLRAADILGELNHNGQVF